MEIDTTVIFGGIASAAVVGGAIMAYGELKTKVITLAQRADAAQQSREKQFERLNSVEKESEVQRTQIDALQVNNNELFRLHEKSNETMAALNTTLSTLVNDVHYIKDFIKRKSDG